MKKKTVAAMLVMCMALSATACGGSDTKETKTETTQDTGDKKDSASSDKKTSASAVRLVSVSDVSKYVTIGEYKGLTLDRASVTVTDDDVQAEIDYNLEENGTEVNDGTVEEGDSVTINFTGTIDGKEFDGGSAEDYDLVIGEGGMIDGFEDGIIGMKKGETKELDLTFPDDYYEESVAGKPVVFIRLVLLRHCDRPCLYGSLGLCRRSRHLRRNGHHGCQQQSQQSCPVHNFFSFKHSILCISFFGQHRFKLYRNCPVCQTKIFPIWVFFGVTFLNFVHFPKKKQYLPQNIPEKILFSPYIVLYAVRLNKPCPR